MTLIESLVLAALHGFGRFVPISSETHTRFLERFLPFSAPDSGWKATFALGALLALTLYFIHDWASILSSFIRVTAYRKRPMTLDERYPFFMLFCVAIPFATLWAVFKQFDLSSFESFQELLARWELAGLIGGTLFLFFAERWSKKSRGPFDLGILDSIILGIGQLASWIPGVGGTLGMLGISQLRNYHLEAATKSTCLMSLPFIAYEAFHGLGGIQWKTSEPLPNTSWFQWSLALFVSTVGAFIALRVLNEQIRQNGFGKLILYRALVTVAAAGLYFFG